MAAVKTTYNPVQLSSVSRFRAVIFDLDGVIVDSEDAHFATFNQTVAPLGIKIDFSVWRHDYTGAGSRAIMADLFAKNGIRESVDEWVAKRAGIYQKYIEKNGLPSIEGFMELRLFLEQHGVKMAVASGGHKPHVAESLRAIGIQNTVFVAAEDVKNSKPAPDLFLLAARKINVLPSECIVFEDSLAGMQASKSANMPCIALATSLPPGKLSGKAALIVDNFKSTRLKDVLFALIARNKALPVERTGLRRGKKSGKRKKGKKIPAPWWAVMKKASRAPARKSKENKRTGSLKRKG